MIKLVFVNESCQNSAFFKKIRENSAFSEHINKPLSHKVKKDRELAYGALSYLLSKLFLIDEPRVDFDRKPTLLNKLSNKLAFNISHTDGAVVVAITDEYESVGVDVEGLIQPERARRISERLLTDKETNKDDLLLFQSIELAALYYNGEELVLKEVNRRQSAEKKPTENTKISIKEIDKNESDPYLATEGYTLLEATLKCDGGGFASLKRYGEIKACCKSASLWFLISGREYSLSLCCL
ncbi:MAG: hypothetical protein J6Q85_05260 [Clostridia bacterium]|nr:hypothetical protein [Clostridia bacterium]